MDSLTVPTLDTKMLTIAHELALGMREPRDILADQGVSDQDWTLMQRDPRFQALLASKMTEWNSALNTAARVKMKAAAMVELNLDQFQLALMDETVTAPQRLEVAKFIAKLGGLAQDDRKSEVPGGNSGTGNFQVKIYMGGKNDSPMVIEGDSPNVLTVD